MHWALLLLAFWLSGFAGLVYQTAWTREFAFVFGTSELAVAAVLAAYFGGLAAGAALVARPVSRLRRPLRVYAVLELLVGACALAVPWAIRATMRLHVELFASGGGRLEEAGALSLLFYVSAAFVILLVPTGCMGATLPLLVRHAVRRETELGRRVARLYGVNTFGAVAGVVAAGFWLLPGLGLQTTVVSAAAVNLFVFLLALGLARGERLPADAAERAAPRSPRFDWILPWMAISGAVSFLYEVLWTRLLSHAIGGSLYGFATMLATFLLGIALGAWLATPWTRTRSRASRGFAWAQLLTAGFAACAYAAVGRTPDLTGWLVRAGLPTFGSEVAFCALVLLPSALAIGVTFPCAVRMLARSAADAGPAAARVYAWNTVGAILGALGAGFLVIPRLGFAGSVALGIAVNLGLCAAVALRSDRRARWLAAAALAGGIALALAPPEPPWRLLRTSPFSDLTAGGEVVHHSVGRSASVLVLEDLGEYLLRQNGLPESAIQPPGGRPQRYLVARWLGGLPSLMRPGAETLLVVGLGGGIALEALPASLRSIDVVEIEHETVRANQRLAPLRREDPLADPRVRVHVNDARNALLLTGRRFDAIVSQPSHPWTVGASHLYTREFFELVRGRLAEGGVFVQWIGLHFVDESLLKTLVATLRDVFPEVRAYRPARRPALLFVAALAPLPNRAQIDAVIEAEPAAYAELGLFDALDVEAAWVMDSDAALGFSAGAPLNLDRHNRLEARSPWIVRSGAPRSPLAGFTGWDPLPPRATALPTLEMIRRLLERGEHARARLLQPKLPAGAERDAARGLRLLARGRRAIGERALRRALAQDPRQPEARALLLRLAAARAPDAPAAAPMPLTPLEEACWQGWRAQRSRDWEGVQALDARLEAAHPREPLHREAGRLRAWWRVASQDPALAREALAILDPVLAGSARPGGLLLRARAALSAGLPRAAVATLAELANARPAGAAQRDAVRAGIVELLAALPDADPFPAWRAALDARLAETDVLLDPSATP